MKKIKFFILGLFIVTFGLYIVFNNINVNASTEINPELPNSTEATIEKQITSFDYSDIWDSNEYEYDTNLSTDKIYGLKRLFFRLDTDKMSCEINDANDKPEIAKEVLKEIDYTITKTSSNTYQYSFTIIEEAYKDDNEYSLRPDNSYLKPISIKWDRNTWYWNQGSYQSTPDYWNPTVDESNFSTNSNKLTTHYDNNKYFMETTGYFTTTQQFLTLKFNFDWYKNNEHYVENLDQDQIYYGFNIVLRIELPQLINYENGSSLIFTQPFRIPAINKIYKCNPNSSDTLLLPVSTSKYIDEEGKYKGEIYSDNGTLVKTLYFYLITSTKINILDENGNNITTASSSNSYKNIGNSPNIKLSFNTSLDKIYLKEIIDSITFTCDDSSKNITYTSDTKNKIIDGDYFPLNIIENSIDNFTCEIDNSKIFDFYQFTIDTENPDFQFTPLENQEIISYSNVTQGGLDYLTAKNVRITWLKENCELKINDSNITYNYDDLNHLYYFDLTSPNNYEIKIESESGTIVKKNIYISEEVFLTGVTQTNTLYKSDLESNPYFKEIKLDATTYYDDIDATKISYTMYLNDEIYEPNTLIKEEGDYNLHVEYNIGSAFDYNFTIDKTAPYMNVEYLQSQGYGSLNSWYNTFDENGNTYSFSYYDISDDAKTGIWQYAWERESTSFTEIIPYSPNWNYYSEKFKMNVTGFDTYLANKSDGNIYVYKRSSGTGYIAYFRYENYISAKTTVVKNSIKACYSFKNDEFNPYPNNKYFEYLSFKEKENDYPIFYNSSSIELSKKSELEKGFIYFKIYNYFTEVQIYEGSTPKINNPGLYKIIEFDSASNSTTYFFYYFTSKPECIISTEAGENHDIEKNISSKFTVEPVSQNIFTPEKYSIIEYTLNNNETIYYNYFDIITGKNTPLLIQKDGIYSFKIHSIFNLSSEPVEVKLYQKEIINEIEILKDDESDTALLVKFHLEDPIQNYQITSINIFKNDIQQYGLEDYNGTPIEITNTNDYEFIFKSSGKYIIEIYELCGHRIKKELELNIGSPRGYFTKTIYTSSGSTEEDCDENTIYHNNIVYFRWNPKKTSYTATITNLNTSIESTYLNGDKIQSEGNYKITLMNGDKFQEYFVTIDKTAPIGFIIDSKITNSDGYILSSNNLPTTNKITSTYYTSGNREGISVNCLEPNVILKLYNNDELEEEISLNKIFTGIENEEKTFIFKLYDLAGNNTIFYLTLDYKLAEYTISSGSHEIENGSYVNQSFRFTSEEEIIIKNKTDDKTVLLGQKITYEMSDIKQYDFIITDEYGNIGYVTIYYDNTTPELNIYHIAKDNTETLIENKAQINNAFKICWNPNKDYYVKISYQEEELDPHNDPVNNGDIISKELNPKKSNLNSKKYTITVTNKAGTERIYYIYLCNTFLGCDVYNGNKLQESSIKKFITNQYVKFVLNSGTATLNNEAYKSNTRIEEDGFYNLIITDEYGNQFEYNFEIDTIAPIVNLKTTTFFYENGSNGDITLEINEENIKIYQISEVEKMDIPLGFIFSKEGKYNLEVIDKANNKTSIEFIIDKTAPAFTSTGFILNPTITKENVKFNWDEELATATLNKEPYKSNTQITADAEYEFILSDIYGNQNIFNFIIDSTIVEYITTGLNNKMYSNDFVIVEFDYNKYTAKIKTESSEATYSSGEKIINENKYIIEFTSIEMPDKIYSLYFTIDKTAPSIELETLSAKGFIEEDGKFYTNNSFIGTYNEENTCYINDGSINKIYESGKLVIDENSYTITITDLAGNSTIYYIIIDKSDISFNLLNDKNESLNYKLNESTTTTRNNYYNSNIKIILPKGAVASIGDKEYVSDSFIEEEGDYTIKFTNFLGTESIFKFTIDKTAPSIVIESLLANNKTSDSVTINIQDSNDYEMFINEEKTTRHSISENGIYNLKCIDIAGNESQIQFEILTRNLKDFIKYC